MSCLGAAKSLTNAMRLIKLKKIMLAGLGSVMGGLSALLIILPLAGAIGSSSRYAPDCWSWVIVSLFQPVGGSGSRTASNS